MDKIRRITSFILILITITFIILLTACTAIRFCKGNNCATYVSIGKDHAYIEAEFNSRTVFVKAVGSSSSKGVEAFTKGLVKGLK